MQIFLRMYTATLFILSLLSVGSSLHAEELAHSHKQELQTDNPQFSLLRSQIAQKLFIDLRYYCEPKTKGYCQKPLIELPEKLKKMLANTQVGGVILFSENLKNTQQILRLNKSLQKAVLSTQDIPLYIGIDQEGGRVSRLPQHQYLGFAGNMAIGATLYSKHDAEDTNKQASNTFFAEQTGTAIAKQLDYLGFNVNFAPVLDVNSNPNNPIINVRSYGQSASQVAIAGGAMIEAMQNQGVATAAKHFPGHGDTHVDSHVGLPVVNHSLQEIYEVDLAPFIQTISNPQTQPDMVMSAHIQYPALDDTEFISKDGESTILPATLSEKILTGLLRKKLAYKGLIVTDSLEMAAISQFLNPQEAVIKAFRAGADITLMPYKIESAEDADAFIEWLNSLTLAISKDPQLLDKINSSYQAILKHKKKLNLHKKMQQFLRDDYPSREYDGSRDILLARQLSQASFTQIKPVLRDIGEKHGQLTKPAFISHAQDSIVAIMPDKIRCRALIRHAKQAGLKQFSCISALSQQIPKKIKNVDLFVVGDVTPALSFYESKATEGISAKDRLNPEDQMQSIKRLMQSLPASTQKVLLKLRAPYVSIDDLARYDAIFASYDYQVIKYLNGNLEAPSFETFIAILWGRHQAQGKLPVVLNSEVIGILNPSDKANATLVSPQ